MRDAIIRAENNVVSCNLAEKVSGSFARFCGLLSGQPDLLRPEKGIEGDRHDRFREYGFELYPTVKHTTLCYDAADDCFYKVLHPLTLKRRISALFVDRAAKIYRTWRILTAEGVKMAAVLCYGTIKRNRLPFFVMGRLEGKSLYDLLIREKQQLPSPVYYRAIDQIAKVHAAGYWLGDAHLSHIFVDREEITGFIDIDSFRQHRVFRQRHFAKDLAGMNHPQLPMGEAEKRLLLDYYMDKSGILTQGAFCNLVSHYTGRRWTA